MMHTKDLIQKESRFVFWYFCNNHGSGLGRTALGLLRSLLHQTLSKASENGIRGILERLVSVRNQYSDREEPESWLNEEELKKQLRLAIQELCLLRPVFIVIDAMDALGEISAIATFRFLLSVASEKSPLHICVSSRYWPILNLKPDQIIRVEEENASDIQLYANTLSPTDAKEICKQSDGFFFWARLVAESVRSKNISFADSEMHHNQPKNLSVFYENLIQGCEAEANLLFQWICFAEQPLQHSALLDASDSRPMIDDQRPPCEDLEYITRLSGGLTRWRGVFDCVHFFHPSLREYWLNRHPWNVSRARIHHKMAKKCAEYVSRTDIQKSVEVLKTPSLLFKQYPFLRYAHNNWGIHARKAEEEGEDVGDVLDVFDDTRLRHWLYLTSILTSISGSRSKQPTTGATYLHVFAHFGLLSAWNTTLANSNSPEDLNAGDASGRTPMSYAAASGYEAIVQALISKTGVDPDIPDATGRTPAWYASCHDHFHITKLLLDAGANPTLFLTERDSRPTSVTAECSASMLTHAAESDELDLVRRLLKLGVDVNEEDGYSGRYPLSAAASRGNTEISRILLDHGADVNCKGWPLGMAAGSGHLETVQLLLQRGADVNGRNYDDETATSSAAEAGHDDIIHLLLENGADVNSSDFPLVKAAAHAPVSTASLLVEHGADVNQQGSGGCTPLYTAAEANNVEVVRFLLDQKADVNLADEVGRSPLWAAAISGNQDVVQVLLQRGADLEQLDCNKWTPLIAAASVGDVDIVQALIQAGANMEAQDDKGKTPLLHAAKRRDLNLMNSKLLIDAGAKVDVVAADGATALSLAARVGREDGVKLLLSAHGWTNDQVRFAYRKALERKEGGTMRLLAQTGLLNEEDLKSKDDGFKGKV